MLQIIYNTEDELYKSKRISFQRLYSQILFNSIVKYILQRQQLSDIDLKFLKQYFSNESLAESLFDQETIVNLLSQIPYEQFIQIFDVNSKLLYLNLTEEQLVNNFKNIKEFQQKILLLELNKSKIKQNQILQQWLDSFEITECVLNYTDKIIKIIYQYDLQPTNLIIQLSACEYIPIQIKIKYIENFIVKCNKQDTILDILLNQEVYQLLEYDQLIVNIYNQIHQSLNFVEHLHIYSAVTNYIYSIIYYALSLRIQSESKYNFIISLLKRNIITIQQINQLTLNDIYELSGMLFRDQNNIEAKNQLLQGILYYTYKEPIFLSQLVYNCSCIANNVNKVKIQLNNSTSQNILKFLPEQILNINLKLLDEKQTNYIENLLKTSLIINLSGILQNIQNPVQIPVYPQIQMGLSIMLKLDQIQHLKNQNYKSYPEISNLVQDLIEFTGQNCYYFLQLEETRQNYIFSLQCENFKQKQISYFDFIQISCVLGLLQDINTIENMINNLIICISVAFRSNNYELIKFICEIFLQRSEICSLIQNNKNQEIRTFFIESVNFLQQEVIQENISVYNRQQKLQLSSNKNNSQVQNQQQRQFQQQLTLIQQQNSQFNRQFMISNENNSIEFNLLQIENKQFKMIQIPQYHDQQFDNKHMLKPLYMAIIQSFNWYELVNYQIQYKLSQDINSKIKQENYIQFQDNIQFGLSDDDLLYGLYYDLLLRGDKYKAQKTSELCQKSTVTKQNKIIIFLCLSVVDLILKTNKCQQFAKQQQIDIDYLESFDNEKIFIDLWQKNMIVNDQRQQKIVIDFKPLSDKDLDFQFDQQKLTYNSQVNYIQKQLDITDIWSNLNDDIKSDSNDIYYCYLFDNCLMDADKEDFNIYLHNVKFLPQDKEIKSTEETTYYKMLKEVIQNSQTPTQLFDQLSIQTIFIVQDKLTNSHYHLIQNCINKLFKIDKAIIKNAEILDIEQSQFQDIKYFQQQYFNNIINYDKNIIVKNIQNIIQILSEVLLDKFNKKQCISKLQNYIINEVCQYICQQQKLEEIPIQTTLLIIFLAQLDDKILEQICHHLFAYYRKSTETRQIIQGINIDKNDIKIQNIYNQLLIIENMDQNELILGKLYLNLNQLDKQQNKMQSYIFNSINQSLLELIQFSSYVSDLNILISVYVFDDKDRLKMLTENVVLLPQQKENIRIQILQLEDKICQSYDRAIQCLKLIESLYKNKNVVPLNTELFILQCFHYFSLISQLNVVDYLMGGFNNITMCQKISDLTQQFINGVELFLNRYQDTYQTIQINILTLQSQDNILLQKLQQFFSRKDIQMLYYEYYRVLQSFEQLQNIRMDSLFTGEQTILPKLRNHLQNNKNYKDLVMKLNNCGYLEQKNNIKQLSLYVQRYQSEEEIKQYYQQSNRLDSIDNHNFIRILGFGSYLVAFQSKQQNQEQIIEIITTKYIQMCQNYEQLPELVKYSILNSYYSQQHVFVNSFSDFFQQKIILFKNHINNKQMQLQIQQTLILLISYAEQGRSDILVNILLNTNLQQFDYTVIKQLLTKLQPTVVNVLYYLQKYNLNNKAIKSEFICPIPGLSIPILLPYQQTVIPQYIKNLCYKLFNQGEILINQESFNINLFIENVIKTIKVVNQSQIDSKAFIKNFVYKNIFEKQQTEQLQDQLQKLKLLSNSQIHTFYMEYFCYLVQVKQKLRTLLFKQHENDTNSQVEQLIKQYKCQQSKLKELQIKKEQITQNFQKNQQEMQQIQRSQAFQQINQTQDEITRIHQLIRTCEQEFLQLINSDTDANCKAQDLVSKQLNDYYVIKESDAQLLTIIFFQITGALKFIDNQSLNQQIIQLKLKDNKIIYTNQNNGVISQQNQIFPDLSQIKQEEEQQYFGINIYPSTQSTDHYFSPLLDANLSYLNLLLKQLHQRQIFPTEQNKLKEHLKQSYKHNFLYVLNHYTDQLGLDTPHSFVSDDSFRYLKPLLEYYTNLIEEQNHQLKLENKFLNQLKLNQFDKIDYEIMMLREDQMKKPLQQQQSQQQQIQTFIQQQIDHITQIRNQVSKLIDKYGPKWQQYLVSLNQNTMDQSVRKEMCKKPVQQILALTGFQESVVSGLKKYADIDVQGDQQASVYLLNKLVESAGIYSYMVPNHYGELLLKQVILNRKFGYKFIENRQNIQSQGQNNNQIFNSQYRTLKQNEQNTQPYALILSDPCVSVPIYESKIKANHLGAYIVQLLSVAVQSYTTTASAPGLDHYFFIQDGQIPELSLCKINDFVEQYNQTISNLVQSNNTLKTQQIDQLLNSECCIMHWKLRDVVVLITFLILQQKFSVAQKLINFSLNKMIFQQCKDYDVQMALVLSKGFNLFHKLLKTKTINGKLQLQLSDINNFCNILNQQIEQLNSENQEIYLSLHCIKMAYITVLLYYFQFGQSSQYISNLFQQKVIQISELIYEKYKDPQLALNILPICQDSQALEDKLNTLAGNFDKVRQRENINGIMIRDAVNQMLLQKNDQSN